jgi:hypothetical protein
VVSSSPNGFSITNGTTLVLGVDSQICRGGCSATWEALRPGDRVDIGIDWSVEPPFTRWVNVNSWSDYAQIDAVDGDRVQVHSTRHPEQPNPEYWVIVAPDTRINPRSDGTAEAIGSLAGAHVGQPIYFTGSAQGPADSSVVIATAFFFMG